MRSSGEAPIGGVFSGGILVLKAGRESVEEQSILSSVGESDMVTTVFGALA